MNRQEELRAILRQAGSAGDNPLDLAETALALAALERPEPALDGCRRHLAQLVEAVAAAQPEPDAAAQAAALRDVLAHRFGYQGDSLTYEDQQNANLIRVIERRRGLPVALGILYIHVGRAQGWELVGINFPGHFLVRLDAGGRRVILDPFHDGMVRDPVDLRGMLKIIAGPEAELRHEHYAPVTDREILLRLQNNIKLRYLRSRQIERAVAVLDGMLIIAPDAPMLWREAGLMQVRLGNVDAAINALDHFIARGTDERLRHEAAVLVQRLKSPPG